MHPDKLKTLCAGTNELFVHDRSDLADYDTFFEFVLGNGEMMGRVDALHSQHIRNGAKKDVLCVRFVDLWGEQTYPVHRGRPGGRFISKLLDASGNAIGTDSVNEYRQRLDPLTGVLATDYSWKNGGGRGRNHSEGFMSKARRHLMAHRYVDTVEQDGCVRTFGIETMFPYHSRASVFYFKKPYNPKRWAWGEVEHENEIEPQNNSHVSWDPDEQTGVITFATTFPKLATSVIWVLRPLSPPDSWKINEETGGLELAWNLTPGVEHEAGAVIVGMTDRDSRSYRDEAVGEANNAAALGWDALASESTSWWKDELSRSSVSLPDKDLQLTYDVSMYYLLNSTGGSYWGFIGTDNVIYETCMCDNMIMLQALVETSHLEIARRELALLDRILPAAKQNAKVRIRAAHDRTEHDGALMPFYMTEDGIELWQDNVFGLYTSVSAFHFLALLKTGRYETGEDFLERLAYPWFRSYAEYGRISAEWDEKLGAYILPLKNVGGGGEGYWWWVTMSQKRYYRTFAGTTPLFRYSDLPPIESFPGEELDALSQNWIDVVLNFKWILTETANYAEQFGLDPELRKLWREVASKLYVPENEEYYMSNIGPDAKPSIGGAPVGGLYWPAEGTFEKLDSGKVSRTFGEILTQRRIDGIGKRGGRAWDAVFAFAFAYMGHGEDTYASLRSFGTAADHRGIEMRESVPHQNYYYLLNHGSFVLLTKHMLLQSFNGKVRVFHSIPAVWRRQGVSFSGLPAEGGYRIDARTGPEGTRIAVCSEQRDELLRISGLFDEIDLSPESLDLRVGPVRFALEGGQGDIQIEMERGEKGHRYTVDVNGEVRTVTASPTVRFTASLPAKIAVVQEKND